MRHRDSFPASSVPEKAKTFVNRLTQSHLRKTQVIAPLRRQRRAEWDDVERNLIAPGDLQVRWPALTRKLRAWE